MKSKMVRVERQKNHQGRDRAIAGGRKLQRTPSRENAADTVAAREILGNIPDRTRHNLNQTDLIGPLGRIIGNKNVNRVINSQVDSDTGNSGRSKYAEPAAERRDNDASFPALHVDESANQEQLEDAGPVREALLNEKEKGRSMEPEVLPEAVQAFGPEAEDVHIHNDPTSNKVANAMRTQAFTMDQDIYFAKGAYKPDSEHGSKVLSHELTHATQGQAAGRIGFWGAEQHRNLTTEAMGSIKSRRFDVLFTMQILKYVNAMDLRLRRLLKVAIPGIKHYAVKWFKKLLPKSLRNLFATPKIPPEGPQHGEGGMYKIGINDAKNINVKAQEEYIEKAAAGFRKADELAKGEEKGGSFYKLNKKVGPVSAQAFEDLGDALHIAQDRGSHDEGAKGMGHDNPDENYDPDNPTHNPTGYEKGKKNSIEVLKKLLSRAWGE